MTLDPLTKISEFIFSILDLLPSMIATRADDLPVINDSEAFQYVGKAVAMCGLVSAAPISPHGTALINFGREYLNQTITALIAIAQGSLTLLARITRPLLISALSLILSANHSHAALGWTLAQFEQQYGKPVLNQEQIAGRIGYVFTREDYIIAAFFLNRRVSRIMYICRSDSLFNWARARALLGANAPDAIWGDASKNETDNSYRIIGTKDGMETDYASLTDDGTMLAIWTKEDDEAGRTSPKLDTPSLPSVSGSNEKSTDEIPAGQASSIDSGLSPEIDHPDVKANTTSWSPSQRQDSAHAAHTKIPKVRLRSSVHPRHIDVKTRLIALWHQSLRHEKSRGSTLVSNSNKGVRKKVGRTAEARH